VNNYTDSHMEKGAVYDTEIFSSPMDAYMAKVEKSVLLEIVEKTLNGNLGNYVDFACGTGRIISSLEKCATKSIGVDVSQSMVDIAKEKCERTQFFIKDVTKERLDFPPIDVVTSFRFFGNAQQELRDSVLQYLHSILRKDGLLILNNHRNPVSISNRLFSLSGGDHEMDLTYDKLRESLNRQGFTVLKTLGIGGWIFRHSFQRKEILESKMANVLERVSRVVVPTSLCPDMILIAKKH
jgi:SAM-dependent methyltransferase